MTEYRNGFALRELTFYGLPSSKSVASAKSSAQALKKAGLDWTVRVDPVFRKRRGGKFDEIPDRFCIVREDTDVVLGNVGKSYVPLQNVEAFTYVDELVGEGAASYEVALELKGGKQVVLVAKLDEGWSVLGDDPHDLYVIFRNGHDGGRAVQELITPVRLRCVNMMPLATHKAAYRFAVVHSARMHENLEAAHATLGRVKTYAEEYEELAEKLAVTKVGPRKARSILEHVIPARPKAEETRRSIENVFAHSPALEAHHGDGWGFLNAVTEYMEHMRRDRGREGRFIDTLDGSVRRLRQDTIEAILR